MISSLLQYIDNRCIEASGKIYENGRGGLREEWFCMASTRKVFVLGRTGSGKSTTVRLLTEELQQLGWAIKVFNDYPILRTMFLDDTEHRLFQPTKYEGFEVINPSVFDTALTELEREIQNYQPTNEKTLIAIEFSRNNYYNALSQFGDDFLQDAHYLFVVADLRICLERASKRGIQSTMQDDYFVKDIVLLHHFPCPYMPLHIGRERVSFIHNMDSLDVLAQCVKKLVSSLLASEEEYLLSTVR